MPRFTINGDLVYTVTVEVDAANREAAIEKAEAGEFTIVQEFRSDAQFSFDGNDDGIEEIPE